MSQVPEFELSIGDSLTIGNQMITLVDVERGEAAFRIEDLHAASLRSATADVVPPAK